MKNLLEVLRTRWKTIAALILALVALIFDLVLVWGIFCLFWASQNIRHREAYFVERIERDDNPILYWIIVSAWLAAAFFYFYLSTMQ
ncbi:hypothetical protein [Vibrio sp. HN007]|uniref:hypothetical protein n=1 Tax=Vibrio iocasae TaxID=3098914 RepID=UPI0035D49150